MTATTFKASSGEATTDVPTAFHLAGRCDAEGGDLLAPTSFFTD
jgi:hypothetical protein